MPVFWLQQLEKSNVVFVAKAVEQLEQSGSQFLGVVLNKVDMTVDKYGSYGSYGSYGEYGKKIRPKRRSFKSTSS